MVETRGRPPKDYDGAIESYRKRPAKWTKDVYGVELWEKQEEILNAVINNRYTAVKSCYGSGKSYLAGILADAFVHLYPHSIAVTTAPSYRQLDNIWGVIHRIKEEVKAPLGSKLLKHEIQCGPQHYAMGFTTNMPERLQGIHASHILIIEDESAGIDSTIHKRLVDALMTGADAHFLAIGNPLSPEGHFYEMFSDPNFKTFTISAFDTPNVKAGKEIIPGLVTKEWVEDQREKYGEDSPIWKSQVLGEFPPSSEEMLIPYTWAIKAQERWIETEPDGPEIYGLDPSGGGLDEAALVTRAGSFVYPAAGWVGLSGPNLIRQVLKQVNSDGVIYIDDVGVGFGIKGDLQESSVYTEGVTGQANPEDDPENRFKNLRAELYWRLREAIDPNGENPLAIPKTDDKMFNQLVNLKYEIDSKGRIQIESKKKMRSRGMESPNRADALMLTMKPGYGNFILPINVGVKDQQSVTSRLVRSSPFEWVGWEDYYN